MQPGKGLVLSIILFTAGLCSASPLLAAEKTSTEGARIEIQAPRFEFEPVIEGTIVEHEFEIANTGKTPLTIEKIRSSCGCTTADFTRSLPPGGTGQVVVKGNTEGYGGKNFYKTITLFCNDMQKPRPKLYINGQVRRFADIKPSKAILRGTTGQQAQATVRITPEPDFPFQVVASYADERLKNKIVFTLQHKGNHYLLTVKNQMKTLGRYWGVIHLKTDNPEKSEIQIRVRGIITESVS